MGPAMGSQEALSEEVEDREVAVTGDTMSGESGATELGTALDASCGENQNDPKCLGPERETCWKNPKRSLHPQEVSRGTRELQEMLVVTELREPDRNGLPVGHVARRIIDQ